MTEATSTGRVIPTIVEMFRFQAWIAMGKVAHPSSGKVERHLDSARQAIDLLAELESKTEGNRSDDETRLLQGALTELRLNYLEERKKPEPEEEGAAGREESADEAGSEDPSEPVA